MPSIDPDSRQKYYPECINPSNKDKNIYTYCQHTFSNDNLLLYNCRLDACRLCCATQDIPNKIISSLTAVTNCFSECQTKFGILPRRTS